MRDGQIAVNQNIKKIIRTAQTFFPGWEDIKYTFQRTQRRLRRTPFEEDFNALQLFPESSDAVFVDVGANRGQSIDAILLKRRNGAVISFEPNGSLYQKLCKLYRDNPRVTVHNLGLGSERGEFKLFVPSYRGFMFDGLASFDKESAATWLRGQLYGYQEALLEVHEVNCEILRMDDLALKPSFIKLDVQGFELPALQGAENTLDQFRPILLIETPDTEIKTYLKRFGYVQCKFDRGALIPSAHGGALNSFFLMPQALAELGISH